MEQNVGGLDRTARLVGGPAVVLVGVLALLDIVPAGTTLGVALLAVGLVVLLTGVTRFCLLHRLLGINTCQR